jgi:hypothetical protein
MKLSQQIKEAAVGINVLLTVQELIILKDTIESFNSVLHRADYQKPAKTQEVRVNLSNLMDITSFLNKLTVGVKSMKECKEDLFRVPMTQDELEQANHETAEHLEQS